MDHIGLIGKSDLSDFDLHVRTLLLAYPVIFTTRLDVMRHMYMSQCGGGFEWSRSGKLLDDTELGPDAELQYERGFYEDVDLFAERNTKSFSKVFNGADVYYKLSRAERQFRLLNIDAIAYASPPNFDIGISPQAVLDRFNPNKWNCLNIPDHADPAYRKAGLEVIARVLGTLKEHRDTKAYKLISEALQDQAREPEQPKI